jgi:hypothetical protein
MGMVSSGQLPLDEDVIVQTFRRFDADGSGYITSSDLEHILGKTFQGHVVNDLLTEADFDHDGRISFQEFSRYLKDGRAAENWQQEASSFFISQKQPGQHSKSLPLSHVPKLMKHANEYNRKPNQKDIFHQQPQPQCTPCAIQ